MKKKKVKNKMDKEWQKVYKDVGKFGLGIYDGEHKVRINHSRLAFVSNDDVKHMKSELQLRQSLAVIKEIYKKKFGDTAPYDLELFNKDQGLFVERMIRAVEICSLNWALNNPEGFLNMNERPSITKGRRNFIWEG